MARARIRGGDFFPSSPSFLQNVYCPKRSFREKTHYRSLPSEQASKEEAFQNGRPLAGFQMPFQGPVGGQAGFEGCLPSRPLGPGRHEVFRFRPRKESVLFQGPSFRPLVRPVDLHKAYETYKEKVESPRYSDIFLSRRFLDSGKIFPRGSRAHQGGNFSSAGLGIRDKLVQVISGSDEGIRVPRSCHRSGGSDVLSPRGQDFKAKGSGKVIGETVSAEVRTGDPGGLPEFCGRFLAPRETASKTYSEMGEQQLFPPQEESEDTSGRAAERSPPTMVAGGVPEGKIPCASSSTHSDPDDGCLGRGLVRGSPSRDGGGVVGGPSTGGAHKLDGTEGDPPSNSSLPSSPQGQMCQPEGGQPGSSGLCQTPGFPEITEAVDTLQEDPGVVLSPGDFSDTQTPQGSPQCSSRQGLQISPYRDRVVPRSGDVSVDLQVGGIPFGGPLRHMREFPLSDVRVPLPRPESLEGGRLLIRLERMGVNLCLSSSPDLGPGDSAPNVLYWGRLPDCALLALQDLVPPALREMPEEIPPPRGGLPDPGDEPRDNRPPEQFRFDPIRLDLVRRSLLEEGLSLKAVQLILSCHKKNTISNYQSTWTKFLAFLDLEEIPHRDVLLCHVINFLASEVQVFRRAYRTIASYKCALQLPLLFHLKLDICVETTRRFLEGCYNDLPPSGDDRMPEWELDDLLRYLCTAKFEPLSNVPFKQVAQKALALILLGTGRRLSEIAALSRLSSSREGRLWLEWIPTFRAKMDRASWQPAPPSILKVVGGGTKGMLLCPVRAYNEYISRRTRLTNRVNDDYLWMLKQESLASSFKALVKDSRKSLGKGIIVPIFPHQSKKLAISYSIFYFPALKDKLPPLTGNKSMSVVNRIYTHAVPPLCLPVVLPLGTANPDYVG